MFNRISSTVGCVVWSWQFADPLPKRHISRICEGHEDLPSCKVVLEAIKFKEKPSCVKMTSESEYFLSFNFFLQDLYTGVFLGGAGGGGHSPPPLRVLCPRWIFFGVCVCVHVKHVICSNNHNFK